MSECSLDFLPPRDSVDVGERHRGVLDVPRDRARSLGRTAVEASGQGWYRTADGRMVDWRELVERAVAAKVSIPPDFALPTAPARSSRRMTVQVTNETTMEAAQRLSTEAARVLALNFANGIHPGGGFLNGSRAQEESLCRSSALYQTLIGDPMYVFHAGRAQADSSDWAILSPEVPVFRADDGTELPTPWLMNVLTCAAPVVSHVGQARAAGLLRQRIARVLAIAAAYGYTTLVLGAWGCGAFGNDPHTTAASFRFWLSGDYCGAFDHVTFAITDWSAERRFLQPFVAAFTA